MNLIDRDALLKLLEVEERYGYLDAGDIMSVATVDAAPVVYARWIYRFGSYSTPKCSNCGWSIPYSEDSYYDALNYCPNCGARMDAEEGTKNDRQRG